MGIRINNNFDLLDDQDDGFIVDDRLVRGGYTVVASTNERDGIPLAARKVGQTVYVESHRKEYQLVGGVTNSSWQEKTLSDLELPAYAKLDAAEFSGVLSSVWKDQPLVHPLTSITPQYLGDSEKDHINIQLSETDLQFVGELSFIKGENSGATAIVVVATSTGLVIPSKSATVSRPEYRAGEFIQGERVIIQAGPALARRPQDVMTRQAVESLSITKNGGSCYGHINNYSPLLYTLQGGIETIIDHHALDVVELVLVHADEDHKHLHGEMQLLSPRGDTIKVLRLTRDSEGLLINAGDRNKVQLGDRFKIINPSLMPTERHHLVTKQYVQDMTDRVELTINASYFSDKGLVTDPLDGQTRQLYSFTIPSSTYPDRWPVISIYKIIANATSTDYVKISSSVYRYVVRDTGSSQDIIVQVWDATPSTVKVIIH